MCLTRHHGLLCSFRHRTLGTEAQRADTELHGHGRWPMGGHGSVGKRRRDSWMVMVMMVEAHFQGPMSLLFSALEPLLITAPLLERTPSKQGMHEGNVTPRKPPQPCGQAVPSLPLMQHPINAAPYSLAECPLCYSSTLTAQSRFPRARVLPSTGRRGLQPPKCCAAVTVTGQSGPQGGAPP